LRFGLIGAGRHGARYARHLAAGDVPGACLQALSRRDVHQGRALADELGVVYQPRWQDLLARDDIDAVILVVPVGCHQEFALAVAERGLPLLIEKPFACNAGQAEVIRKAFADRGRPLCVAQTIRFDPLTRELAARAPAFGLLTGFDFQQRLEPRGLPWEDDPASSCGGVVIQTAVHALDALRTVTRATAADVIHSLFDRLFYSRNEDHALSVIALESPLAGGRRVQGMVACSKVSASRQMRYQLLFEDGALEADYIQRTLRVTHDGASQLLEVPPAPTVPALLAAFVAHLGGRGDNPVPPSDALDTMRLVDRVYAAADGEI
jgi:predicted dehydrogenase